jgi:hypothetical protein
MPVRKVALRNGSKKSETKATPLERTKAQEYKIALWLAVSLFFLYLMTTAAHPPYGDESEYFEMAQNLLTRGQPVVAKTRAGADGQPQTVLEYTRFSLGQSLLMLPFALSQRIVAAILPWDWPSVSRFIFFALPAAQSATICTLLFLLVQIVGNIKPAFTLSRKSTAILVLVSALGSQLWPASRTLFADTSVAWLLVFTIYALLRFRYQEGGVGWLVAVACAGAMMFLCKNLLILVWPALAAYATWAVIERRKIDSLNFVSGWLPLAFFITLPLALSVILQLWYNDLRYDSVWLFGYHERREADFGFSNPLLVGLYGILLSSGRSLFLYSPPCILAFFGARNFFRAAPAEAALIAGVALPLTIVYAKWYSWHGGWEWGNRFFLFAIPLLMWLSVPAWRWLDQNELPNITRRFLQTGLLGLFALSLYIQGLGLLIHPAAYWSMTAHELSVLEHPTYEKGIWDIRDDMPLAHFVPEFSPVAAHHWLVQATWSAARLHDDELAKGAPWFGLNPKWAPKRVRPYLGYDLWLLVASRQGGENVGGDLLLAALLSFMTLFGFVKLRTQLVRFP